MRLPCSSLCLAAAVAVLLPSCSLLSQREVVQELPTDKKPAMSREEAAANIGNPLLLNRGDSDSVNYNVQTSEELEKIDNGAEGEVYFTNPDNPDEEIAGITAAFENLRHGNGWLSDYGRGVRMARRESRPLIIWFHDSVISPKSRALGAQLLETTEFNEWCKNRVVRVKIDSGVAIDDRKRGSSRYSLDSINRMARRLGVSERPALVVVAPTGKVTARIDGFDGFLASVDIEIRAGVQAAEKEYAEYQKKLETRGYRTWHAARGTRTVFARLQRFDEAKGMVYLREAGGRVSHTPLERFSKEDIAFVDAQARAEESGGQAP